MPLPARQESLNAALQDARQNPALVFDTFVGLRLELAIVSEGVERCWRIRVLVHEGVNRLRDAQIDIANVFLQLPVLFGLRGLGRLC